ncbi:MAG: HlyD family type I secretion periplasmic adaptor subunit [Thermodesulfobacteriota bacterium]
MKKTEEKGFRANPRPLIVAGLVVILVFFGGLGAWSAFLPFSGAVIAPGKVEISHERKTVQHLEGGIVKDILVREGDVVEKGQVLIKLKRTQVDASVSMTQGQIRAKTAKAARLRAESQMADAVKFPESLKSKSDAPEVAEVMEMEKEIFQSRRTALMGKTSLLNSQIEQLKEKTAGIQEELTAQKEIVETLKEEIRAKQALYESDYIDKAQILELKRRLAERKGRVGGLKQDLAETFKKGEELKLRIVNLQDTYKEEALAELGEIQDVIFELKEKIIPQLDAKRRLTVKAPVSGEIINMRIHSEQSGVIQAGKPILDIVPKQAELIVEARVRPDKITNVKKGQAVRVELSAFNRRTTPPVSGSVRHVSGDQVTRETSTGEQTFYIASINIDKEELQKANAYLSPGMPAVSYIETDERTILGYLLEPILEMMDKSMRET